MDHVPAEGPKRLIAWNWRGHKYGFDRPRAFRVRGSLWFPWVDLFWIKPFTMLRFLSLATKRVAVILHSEPEDPDKSVLSPAVPLTVRNTLTFANFLTETVGGKSTTTMTMTTPHAHAYVESKILANYLKKMNFGSGMSNWIIYVLIIVVVIVVIGMSTGYIKIGG